MTLMDGVTITADDNNDDDDESFNTTSIYAYPYILVVLIVSSW